MSCGKTAGTQADDFHRKESKKLLDSKNSVQFNSLYVCKETLLDVTAWFYIQRREGNIRPTNAPKHMPLEKVIPTRCGIWLPFGITNRERVMCWMQIALNSRGRALDGLLKFESMQNLVQLRESKIYLRATGLCPRFELSTYTYYTRGG